MIRLFFILFLSSLFYSACNLLSGAPGAIPGEENPGELNILSWNLQALFDGKTEGSEYKDYSAESGWTQYKYEDRLKFIAQALRSFTKDGPDVLAVQEVENETVLRDLCEGPLKSWGYRWTAFSALPQAALGLGVLSRYSLTKVLAHGITEGGAFIPRPVLEVWINTGKDQLILFVCHWKSKLGGAKDTEGLRRAAARIIVRRSKELAQSDPGIPWIIAGDLNENHDEFSRRGKSEITALMPYSEETCTYADEALGSILFLSQETTFTGLKTKGIPVLYSPWTSGFWKGSYRYEDKWETIDHLLFCDGFFDTMGWEFASFSVLDMDPFVSESGYPYSFNSRFGRGLSDHLPIYCVLEHE